MKIMQDRPRSQGKMEDQRVLCVRVNAWNDKASLLHVLRYLRMQMSLRLHDVLCPLLPQWLNFSLVFFLFGFPTKND